MHQRFIFCAGVFIAIMSLAAPSDALSSTAPAAIPDYLVNHEAGKEVAQLVSRGQLTEAEKLLNGQTSETLVRERERLRRLRRDFSLTPGQMLKKIQKDIPGFTAEELENLRRTTDIQSITIDGQVRYFRREPVNLYRFNDDARKRRDAAKGIDTATSATAPAGDPAAASSKKFNLEKHVAELVEEAEVLGAANVHPVEFHIRHTITVKPGVVPAGKTIRCWLPYPMDYREQTQIAMIQTTPSQHRISSPASAQRTLHMRAPSGGDQPTTFAAEYRYTRYAYVPNLDPAVVKPTNTRQPQIGNGLSEEPPHIVFTPHLRQLAETIVGDEQNPMLKAQKIFRWMDANIRYCGEMEYAILPNITEKVLQTRRGDCGVHALLFIALCRVSDVPARWQSGWVTKPAGWNMHDWAEFYAEPYGWVPADPSNGIRKSDDPRVANFFFGHIDTYRMIANLDFATEFDPPKTHWRSDPVDSQRGEVEWDGGNLYYDDWDYKVEILNESPSSAGQ